MALTTQIICISERLIQSFLFKSFIRIEIRMKNKAIF